MPLSESQPSPNVCSSLAGSGTWIQRSYAKLCEAARLGQDKQGKRSVMISCQLGEHTYPKTRQTQTRQSVMIRRCVCVCVLMFCSQKRVILTQSIVESLTQVPPSEESHYWLESAHQQKSCKLKISESRGI